MINYTNIQDKQDSSNEVDQDSSSSAKEEAENEKQGRYAILVIDMQNDFVRGTLKCDRAARIIPNIKVLLDKCRQKQVPIFYCVDEHLPIDTYEMKLWGPHAMKNTEGAKVIDELKPSDTDHVIPKRTYSADAKGVNTLVITGLHTNICDRHTSYDAFVRGFEIIGAEDGVEAFTEEEQSSGLDYVKRIYGAKVMKIQDMIKCL